MRQNYRMKSFREKKTELRKRFVEGEKGKLKKWFFFFLERKKKKEWFTREPSFSP